MKLLFGDWSMTGGVIVQSLKYFEIISSGFNKRNMMCIKILKVVRIVVHCCMEIGGYWNSFREAQRVFAPDPSESGSTESRMAAMHISVEVTFVQFINA